MHPLSSTTCTPLAITETRHYILPTSLLRVTVVRELLAESHAVNLLPTNDAYMRHELP